MKRPLFIIIGVIVVIILLAIWVFVLFFGTPQNGDQFANFDFGNTNDPSVVIDEDANPEPTVDVTGPERLRQLTTREVAGFQEVRPDASSSPMVYYIELGTGHVYRINLESGEEVRLSGTTIPETRLGAVTPNGAYMMVRSGDGMSAETVVGAFSSTSEEVTTLTLDETVVDIKAGDDNTFFYSVKTVNSLIGKQYFPDSNTSETLFTIPFREALIVWGNSADDSHFAFPKPTSQLEGFGYEIRNGNILRTAADGYGLTMTGNESFAIFARQFDEEYVTYTHDLRSGTTTQYSLPLLPLKCIAMNTDDETFICAQELTELNHLMPDTWLKGVASFSDSLWEVNARFQNTDQLVNIERESGRSVDVVSLMSGQDDELIYFQNKNDQTLWLYERVIQ